MERYVIDRFEGKYAVCEKNDKTTILVPKYKLPYGCKEQECLIMDVHGMYQKDSSTYKIRKNLIREKMNRLFR
jgi:Protein of unknown function (DUF3006).